VPARRRRPPVAGGLAVARPPVGRWREPEIGASRILIDGRNVQFAMARGVRSGIPALPTTALVARLRASFAPPNEVELILDGHPGGSPSGRVAPAFTVTFSRHATADQVIGDRVTEALRALGPAGAWSVIVVTDDREVRDHARRNGARVEGTAWLVDRLAAPPSASARPGTALGQGRPPRSPRTPRPG
jgi:hypothetical protein